METNASLSSNEDFKDAGGDATVKKKLVYNESEDEDNDSNYGTPNVTSQLSQYNLRKTVERKFKEPYSPTPNVDAQIKRLKSGKKQKTKRK